MPLDLASHFQASATAKNALVYPVGNFTALAVNDAGTGADGAFYKLPTADALQITLPNKADMNAAEGIYRVRISGDWAALSTQTTVLSFIDDTANGVAMGTGLPDDGNEWLDLVFNAAGDEWIATSGGDNAPVGAVATTTARYTPDTDYVEGAPILEPDPNTDEIHVWRADADFRSGPEADFDGTGFTQGAKVGNPVGVETHIVQSDATPRLFSGSGIAKGLDIVQDAQLMPRAFRPALATAIYGTEGGGKIGTAIDPTDGLIYAVKEGKTVTDATLPSLSDNWTVLRSKTTPTVRLAGTTDADDQTHIPYAGDVTNGYLVEVAVSTDRWLPQNYGDRTDEAANYFQVLYDKGQARFEMWAVGTALQNKPYRVTVYGSIA